MSIIKECYNEQVILRGGKGDNKALFDDTVCILRPAVDQPLSPRVLKEIFGAIARDFPALTNLDHIRLDQQKNRVMVLAAPPATGYTRLPTRINGAQG
jgi:hypothetical protein